MYIDPFWFGVATTVATELIIFFVVAMGLIAKEMKKDSKLKK